MSGCFETEPDVGAGYDDSLACEACSGCGDVRPLALDEGWEIHCGELRFVDVEICGKRSLA